VFTPGNNQSYGRFPIAMDRYLYHPQGYVFGLRYDGHKLFKLPVGQTPVPDAQAPIATQAAGQGSRYGLLFGPVGLACALDGRLLVLESVNQRIQAFDVYGKPVAYFTNPSYDPSNPDSSPTIPTLKLVARKQSYYLDLAVEAAGYIYVLSYTGEGDSVTEYQVDLYQPDGTFLVTTPNVPAANLTVDLFRSLYTLNWEIVLDGTGRPQPSITQWLPPAPPPSQWTPEGPR